MAWTPEDSRIQITPEIQQALETASHEEIKDIMHQAMLDQGLVRRDIYNASMLLENPVQEATAAPEPSQQYSHTVKIDGKSYTFEGDSELAVLQKQNEWMRDNLSQPTSPTRTPNVRITTESPIGQQSVFEQAAVEKYLEARGIDVASLRTAENQSRWESATAEFIDRHPNWQGGEHNLGLMQQALINMGLVEPSVENLEKAYNAVSGHLVENEDIAYEKAIMNAQTPDEIAQINRNRFYPGLNSWDFAR